MRRVAFRFFLRAQIRRADGERKAALQRVLDDRELFNALVDELAAEHSQQAGGPLTDFLEWLLDHADEIIALVMKIIPLFV